MTPLPITAIPGLGAGSPMQALQGLSGPTAATAPTAPTAPTAAPTAGGASFQSFLENKIGSVVDLQNQADAASQAVATGQSSDLAGATIAVEKASISMELTGAIRNKVIDAYQEIMRMQV
jgi:flagellar hook-basal body complex protein FliE